MSLVVCFVVSWDKCLTTELDSPLSKQKGKKKKEKRKNFYGKEINYKEAIFF